MKDCIKPNMNFDETGFAYSMSLISGKYKLPILYSLAFYGPFRYNELKRFLDPISFKTLTANLKELEESDLIIRKEYPEIPPKVEYFLSDKGWSLMPILGQLCDWGEINKSEKL
ncbi:MAG TPA: helix-turn-helix transcriptional regulator [Candidatus Eubacterium pullicola]|nr:helix-turn-helix transcriptional regulator [Candidatus Eubacterium pullicola]